MRKMMLAVLLTLPVTMAGVAAQVVPGADLPALPDPLWLVGAPAGGPRAHGLVACYPDLRRLAFDLDHLVELQRLSGDDLRIEVRLGEPPAEAERAAARARLLPTGLPVATESDGSSAAALFAGDVGRGQWCLHDGGKVLWIGRPGAGLDHILAQARAGKLNLDAVRQHVEARLYVLSTFDDLVGKGAVAQVDGLLAFNRRDGLAWALKYMVQVEKTLDFEGARTTLSEACKELAMAPAALGLFADLALRCDPGNAALGRELVQALTPAAPTARGDLHLQLVLLRALVRAGADREVGRQSRMMAKACGEDADTALTLAEILADDGTPQVHADTAQRALDRAVTLGADPRLLIAARYKVLLRCQEDGAAARQLAESYIARDSARVSLNNDAWYLMTQPQTKGRFDALALALCQQMLEDKASMDYFEYDTVGLCMFLNGRLEEAVELQTTAVEKGGAQGNPEYAERLARFAAALKRKTDKQ